MGKGVYSKTSFQSAYRKYHHSETALMFIRDYINLMDFGEVRALTLLDLSAVHITVDNSIVLHRF